MALLCYYIQLKKQNKKNKWPLPKTNKICGRIKGIKPMLLSASPNIQLPTDKKQLAGQSVDPIYSNSGQRETNKSSIISSYHHRLFTTALWLKKTKVYAHSYTKWQIEGNEKVAQHFRRLMWKIKHRIGNYPLIIIAYSVFIAMTRNRYKNTHTHTLMSS